jgi:hypothetical protein
MKARQSLPRGRNDFFVSPLNSLSLHYRDAKKEDEMKIPEGCFVIHQPKYTVPCIFNLNERGTFTNYPSVTSSWGFRVLADGDCHARIQFARLVHRPGTDSKSGPYNWKVEEVLIDLSDQLEADPEEMATAVSDSEIRSALMDQFNEWHDNFVPMKGGGADRADLNRKLTNVVEESKESIRKKLVKKNRQWVLPNIPRCVQDFRRGLYNHVKDMLYGEYRNNGGEDSEPNLIKKIALFNRVLENCNQENLSKPDGNAWENEDEIWQCWIGFAGSESEAHRVCRTMDAVFRDLQLEEVA